MQHGLALSLGYGGLRIPYYGFLANCSTVMVVVESPVLSLL